METNFNIWAIAIDSVIRCGDFVVKSPWFRVDTAGWRERRECL